jgi:hypothetical protein
MQDYHAAVDIFERLLELKPDELGHYTNLGRYRKHAPRCIIATLLTVLILLQFSCDVGGLC